MSENGGTFRNGGGVGVILMQHKAFYSNFNHGFNGGVNFKGKLTIIKSL